MDDRERPGCLHLVKLEHGPAYGDSPERIATATVSSRIVGTMSSSSVEADDELIIEDARVTWSVEGVVRKRFSLQSKCLRALWTSFNNQRSAVLVILLQDTLLLYEESGKETVLPLLCLPQGIWATPHGILMQGIPRKFWGKGCSLGAVRENGTPKHRRIWYTLSDLNGDLSACEMEDQYGYPIEENHDAIIYSSRTTSMVMSYCETKGRHALWKLTHLDASRYAVREVWAQAEVGEGSRFDDGVAKKVVEIDTFNGDPIYCLLTGMKLTSVTLPSQQMTRNAMGPTEANEDFSLSGVTDLAGLVCTRKAPLRDLLVLHNDERLELYSGSLAAPIQVVLIGRPGTSGDLVRLVGIRDPVGKRVTCDFAERHPAASANTVPLTSSIRCAMAVPSPSTLRGYLLDIFEAVLPPSANASLRSKIFTGNPCAKDDTKHIFNVVYEFITGKKEEKNGKPDLGEGKSAGAKSAWDRMLLGSTHAQCKHELDSLGAFANTAHKGYSNTKLNVETVDEVSPAAITCIEALHALYEDCKLDLLRRFMLRPLSEFLLRLASTLQLHFYVDYYRRDCGFTEIIELPTATSAARSCPADIHRALLVLMRQAGGLQLTTNPVELLPPLLVSRDVPECLSWSRKIVRFYRSLDISILARARETNKGEHSNLRKLVDSMVEEQFGITDLDRLPVGVALPLREVLHTCCSHPPPRMSADAYVLIGREDLAATATASSLSLGRAPLARADSLVESSNQISARVLDWAPTRAPYAMSPRPSNAEMNALGLSEKPAYELSAPDTPNAATHGGNASEAKQRTGNTKKGHGSTEHVDGMEGLEDGLTPLRFGQDRRISEVRRLLDSSNPQPIRLNEADDVAEPEQVAALQARLMQYATRTSAMPIGRGAFTVASAHPILTEPLPLPNLCLAGCLPSQHNAVVNLDANTDRGEVNSPLTELHSWPEFHNGAASGLRLAPGGQTRLARTWVVYNRNPEPSYSHAGFLMALGLHGHLRVLAATDVFRYLSQGHDATTVALLLGMAASKKGSLDTAVSKMLFLHIPTRHPPSFPELELSPHVQAAALLGVGLLYEGSANRLMTEILLDEIGRKPGAEVAGDREGYALAAGFALGLVTLGQGNQALGLADLSLEDRLTTLFTGRSSHAQSEFGSSSGSDSNNRSGEDSSSNGGVGGHVMEGSLVNLDVTAPGAILALGLMYIKTNDTAAAQRLDIPSTHYALDYVRPDFILLRLVARSIILWDSIEATDDYIQKQLPEIFRTFDAKNASGPIDRENGHDLEALAQGQVQGLAGACMSIGLKFAGTGNQLALDVLTKYVNYFLGRKREISQTATEQGLQGKLVDRNIIEACMNVVVLSLAVVMAGTGHLPTLKLFRYLHRRLDSGGSISHGSHMAVSMAIGFLFMGAGTRTFSTGNSSIAALIIALYPRFPQTPGDNRCHLQAFRHLYSLASEARCLTTIDVDSGKPCYVPIEIEADPPTAFGATSIHESTTPCLLPELATVKRIQVCGPRYLCQTLVQGGGLEELAKMEYVLYVKRKIGARPYDEDPTGNRSLLSRAFHKIDVGFESGRKMGTRDGPIDRSSQFELLSTFSSNPSLLGFAEYFCGQQSDFQRFCRGAMYECVTKEKPDLLNVHLSLHCGVEALISGRLDVPFSDALRVIWDLKLPLAYYDALVERSSTAVDSGDNLIQSLFLTTLSQKVEEYFREKAYAVKMIDYIKKSSNTMPLNAEFGAFLCLYDIPPSAEGAANAAKYIAQLHGSGFGESDKQDLAVIERSLPLDLMNSDAWPVTFFQSMKAFTI